MMRPSFFLRSYLALARLMAPLWSWHLRRRLGRGKETLSSLQQKLGYEMQARPQGPLVWGHAVGVGEALALVGLFSRLAQMLPEHHFLVTTTARTSGQALATRGLPEHCYHQFCPVDTPDAVKRFLDHWQPGLAIWCEMDLWPLLISTTARRAIPMVLINARLSEKSFAKRRWGRGLYAALLPAFKNLLAQNEATGQRLVALGARPEQVMVTGTIKSLSPALPCDTAALHSLRAQIGTRPVWLLTSSHPGEESIALAAHRALQQQYPDALLIIAPRDLFRREEVLALCAPGGALRSQAATLTDDTSVYIADSFGEMGLWYRLCQVALVGGSLVPIGGHNPHEAVTLGCPVLFGPHVANFTESYAELANQGSAQAVSDAAEIAAAVKHRWAQGGMRDPALCGEDQSRPEPVLDYFAGLVEKSAKSGLVDERFRLT